MGFLGRVISRIWVHVKKMRFKDVLARLKDIGEFAKAQYDEYERKKEREAAVVQDSEAAVVQDSEAAVVQDSESAVDPSQEGESVAVLQKWKKVGCAALKKINDLLRKPRPGGA